MSTLLIDLGNTRLKSAWLRDGRLQDMQAVVHHGQPLTYGLESLLQHPPERVLINSMLGDAIRRSIQQRLDELGIPGFWASSQVQHGGLRNGYQLPERLGSDRWLAMIAAWQSHQGRPVCVVSCGTAVTIDAIAADGQHQGGMILPGVQMMQHSLLQGTQQINLDLQTQPLQLFARNTTQAVQSGCHFAIVGAIRQMLEGLVTDAEQTVQCVLTGGDAQAIAELLTWGEVEYRPQLVLEGLAIVGQNK
ncbi:MAG: type III pantothenate kinase [Gammaproteobacteria bacterium]|nr:type III pantothenate kinase [Gammaproteobacteria bacterium]